MNISTHLQRLGVLRVVHVNPAAQEIALDVLRLEFEEARERRVRLQMQSPKYQRVRMMRNGQLKLDW